jgi:hypothetical protein
MDSNLTEGETRPRCLRKVVHPALARLYDMHGLAEKAGDGEELLACRHFKLELPAQ